MDTIKSIKAINERLAVFERQGLTDSANYQKMIERIQLEGLPTTVNKNGFIRISRAKATLSDISNDSLNRIKLIQTLAQERTMLKKRGIRNREEQDFNIKSYGKVKAWAEANLHEIYTGAREGLAEALDIENMFDDGLRKYDYEYIFEMITRYEKAKLQRDSVYRESEYFIEE